MSDINDCYEILLNYVCNLNCSFCSQGNYNKKIIMTKEMIFKEIYKAKKEGYKKLGISGGEPTVRKDLIEIIKFAKKVGFNFIRIQTNGILLSDYEYAKKLKEAGLTFCKFSITSNNPEIHDKLVSMKGAWKRVIKAVENMKRLKLRMGNNILITKYNYNTLPEIIEFLMKKGITNFVVIYPIYEGNMHLNYKKLGITLGDCKPYFLKAIEKMEKLNMTNEILFLNVPPCFLKGYEDNVIGLAAFNTVVKSPTGELSNLDDNSNSNKVYGEICKKCIWKGRCKGVDKYYIEIFGWKDFIPIIKKEDRKKTNEKILTDDERCLIEILKKKNNATVENIIKISKKIPLCQNCQDANNIINAASRLAVKNIIKIEFKKGKYYFKLL